MKVHGSHLGESCCHDGGVGRMVGRSTERLRRQIGTVGLDEDPRCLRDDRGATDPIRVWVGEVPGEGHEVSAGAGLTGEVLVAGAAGAGVPASDGGCYGHVDGPRFNTRTEIAALRAAGVTAVSQTGGPEAVLCGEAELPYALMGYATDYANGVAAEPTPVEELIRLMGESTETFASVLLAVLPRLDAAELSPPGVVYRFEQ